MKLVFMFIVCASLFTTCSLKKPALTGDTRTFREYMVSFKEVDEITVDSAFIRALLVNNPYESVNPKELHFVKSKETTELCDGRKKYMFCKAGRINGTDGSVLLLYYLALNKQCQYDGIESLFLLVRYDKSGELISEKIIGKYYQVFGANEFIYFHLADSNNVEMMRVDEYESENGWVREQNTETYKF